MKNILVLFVILVALTGQAAADSVPATRNERNLPDAAKSVIRETVQCAEKGELEKLRKVMIKKFTWSFGGDEDADQAISEWRGKPELLKELVKVLKMGCVLLSADMVECPGAGNDYFRAGFVQSQNGWRMEYFVAGD